MTTNYEPSLGLTDYDRHPDFMLLVDTVDRLVTLDTADGLIVPDEVEGKGGGESASAPTSGTPLTTP